MEKYLIDTQIFIWYITGDERLGQNARDIMEKDCIRLISIASIWEMAIKVNIGKLSFRTDFGDLIEYQLRINELEILPISLSHTFELVSLPLHHRDPFDRIILSQAIAEKIPILSSDEMFDAYSIKRIY